MAEVLTSTNPTYGRTTGVAVMSAPASGRPGSSNDDDLIALCARWRRMEDAVRNMGTEVVDDSPASRKVERLADRAAERAIAVFAQIARTPARTHAGLRAKAAVLEHFNDDASEAPEHVFGRGILADIAALT